MSWTINREDEARLCLVLRCFIEEWGSNNVAIQVPKCWSTLGGSRIGRVPLTYETEAAIVIRVDCEQTSLCYEYKLTDPLAAPHTVQSKEPAEAVRHPANS